MLLVGLLCMGVIGVSPLVVKGVGLDIHTLAYAGAAILLGFQMIFFAVFTKLLGIRAGWLPDDPDWSHMLSRFTLEVGLLVSVVLFLLGVGLSIYAVSMWAASDFGAMDPRTTMRWVVPAVTAIALGGELFLAAFFLETLRLPIRQREGV